MWYYSRELFLLRAYVRVIYETTKIKVPLEPLLGKQIMPYNLKRSIDYLVIK